MRALSVKRLTQEDLQDAPKGGWKDKLIYALNLFWQQIYNGLQNGLTPEENMQEQTVSFQLTGNSTATSNNYTFLTNFNYTPSFIEWYIVPSDNSIFTVAPWVSGVWASSRYTINGICGLTTGVKYTITIRLWFPPLTNLRN